MVSRAQGTIEYLVILAVVVVLSLVVVGIATNILGNSSTQVGANSNQLSNKIGVGGISVTEVVADSSGDALISFKNVSGGNLTLTKITPISSSGTRSSSSSFNTPVIQGDNPTSIFLSDVNTACPCNPGETVKTCTFEFIFMDSANNFQRTPSIVTVTTNCVTTINPTDPQKVIGLGSGTLADSWVINSCLELQAMSEHLDGNYALGADINCSETQSWNSGAGFASIGNFPTQFVGSLNGGYHKVTGLFINSSSNYTGLFGYTGGGTISNLGITDENIIGTFATGAIAGHSASTISNSYSTGTISSTKANNTTVGGLVGESYGPISSSYSGATIMATTTTYAGGITGQSSSSISDTYFTGIISGYDRIGGIVGENYGGLSNSYVTGSVTGTYRSGGISGETYSSLSNSFFTGYMYGTTAIGGMSGLLTGGGAVSSAYWYDRAGDNATNCAFMNNTCTKITDGQGGASYFYTITNAPLTSWDFVGTWVARDGNYPVLKWQ